MNNPRPLDPAIIAIAEALARSDARREIARRRANRAEKRAAALEKSIRGQ